MEKYLVSIDSGTQSTRVMIFDTKGNRVSYGASQHPPMLTPAPGVAEHSPDESWNALLAAAKQAFAGFSGDKAQIVGIGIASQRICTNILDESGKQIHNPISWMDSRWYSNFPALGEIKEDVSPMYKHFLAYFSRANWLKRLEPDVYEKAAKYLNVTGYLGYRLTGEFKDSMSLSFGWPVDDIGWSGLADDKHIEVMGMRRSQLPEFIMPGGLIGHITAQAAAETGLPEGCSLFASGGDKQCELLGAGVTAHGKGYITLGTLSGLDVVSSAYTPSPDFGYLTYLSAYPKNYNFEVALDKGFWLISWFRDNFGQELAAEARNKGVAVEELLNREAAAVPAGAEGLVCLPDWSANPARPASKGMFIGFDGRHKRAHAYRALIEGIVMEIKNKADKLQTSLNMSLDELVVGGGGSRGDICVQIIADVFNLPVRRVRESETTSLGIAMCVAAGSGIYSGLDEAIASMSKESDTFLPNTQNHEKYEKIREKVCNKIYPALESVLKDLAEI